MDHLMPMLDVRASLRSLRRSPGTVVIAVAALAMGIGFTTTMFSIAHGGTRNLPFDEPHELVIVTATAPRIGIDFNSATSFDHAQWSLQQRSFDALAAFTWYAANLSGDGESPERRDAAQLTPNTFELLGVRAERGRLFDADDARPGAPAVVVIGHDLWAGRYQSDPAIIGRTIRLDGEPLTVVGVMAAGFAFPINEELWIPLDLPATASPDEGDRFTVLGRLADGVSLDRAATDLDAIASRIALAWPNERGDHGIRAYPFVEMELPRAMAMTLYLMVGVVSLVLLIACANVANLLLARAASRTREVAIRAALGSSRRRIIGTQLLESLLLAVIGGAIGLAIATVAVRFFANATSHIIEAFWMRFSVDGMVVVFATTLAAIAAVVAGVAPGLRAASADPGETLRDRSGGSTGLRIGRLSRSLVVVQVAFACGLLILTAIFVRSALGLRATPFPFTTHDVLTAQLGFTQAKLSDPTARNRDLRALSEQFAAMPGASAVSLVSALPGRGSGNWSVEVDGQTPSADGQQPYTSVMFVTPGFLDVVRSAVDRGRDISWQDDLDSPPVAMVNRSWVARFSSDAEPLGRRVTIGRRDFEIVGVVPDLMMQDIEDARGDGIYLPLLQHRQWTNVRLMAQTAGAPLALVASVRTAVRAVDPDLPVYEIATLHDAIFSDKRVLDAFGTLFFLFGLGALFMTVVGLYGVVAFAVNQRTREIGIRVALGASRRDVLAMVVRQGGRHVAIGLVIGLVIAFGISRVMVAAIEPLRPAGMPMLAAVAGALASTALLAMIVPAKRALRVQPIEALRQE